MVDLLTDLRIFSLVSLFLQSVLYGIYIITSGSCARALTRVNGRWRSKRELQWPFLLAGLFLFVNTTCSLFIQLYKCLELLVHGGFGESGASYHSSIIAPAQMLCQSAVGDFVLIYRTFIVYRRNWKVIAPPVILWLADIGCACRILQLKAIGANLDRWFTAFWGLTVAHNIMITLLLLYRLWRIDRSLPGLPLLSSVPETQLHRFMRSIAESGILYTVAALVVLVCGTMENRSALLVSTAVEMVTVGIAFNLILIRAKQGDDTQQEQRSSSPQFTTIGPITSSYLSTLSSSMTWAEGKP